MCSIIKMFCNISTKKKNNTFRMIIAIQLRCMVVIIYCGYHVRHHGAQLIVITSSDVCPGVIASDSEK